MALVSINGITLSVSVYRYTLSQYHAFRRPLGEDGHFYRLQIEGFADTVLHKTPMRGASAEDGVAAMKAMVAISRSIEEGKKIKLENVTGAV